MVNLANLLVIDFPSGFWTNIIRAFNSVFVNYALSIIILTIVIRLLMSPLDFFNKKVTRQTSRQQAIIKPELEQAQKKYGHDKQLLNQKTMEIYKKNNVSLGGSCGFMLLNLVLTIVIFFTLFAGLNNMAEYKIKSQFDTLKTEYYLVLDDRTTTEAINEANDAVATKYEEVKDKFLWISNIWIADSPLKASIPSFDEYKKIARLKYKDDATLGKTAEELETADKTEYELIMNPLREVKETRNGYFVLVVLAAGLSFLSQFLTQKSNQKRTGVDPNQAGSNKLMMILMPLLMGYFTLIYNAVFALYIITGQAFMMATAPLIDLIIDKIEKKKFDKENNIQKGRIIRG